MKRINIFSICLVSLLAIIIIVGFSAVFIKAYADFSDELLEEAEEYILDSTDVTILDSRVISSEDIDSLLTEVVYRFRVCDDTEVFTIDVRIRYLSNGILDIANSFKDYDTYGIILTIDKITNK